MCLFVANMHLLVKEPINDYGTTTRWTISLKTTISFLIKNWAKKEAHIRASFLPGNVLLSQGEPPNYHRR